MKLSELIDRALVAEVGWVGEDLPPAQLLALLGALPYSPRLGRVRGVTVHLEEGRSLDLDVEPMARLETPAAMLCRACERPVGREGELCGRDDCPGEAQREKTKDFGPVPEPRERAWEKTTGLRVGGQKVEIIG